MKNKTRILILSIVVFSLLVLGCIDKTETETVESGTETKIQEAEEVEVKETRTEIATEEETEIKKVEKDKKTGDTDFMTVDIGRVSGLINTELYQTGEAWHVYQYTVDGRRGGIVVTRYTDLETAVTFELHKEKYTVKMTEDWKDRVIKKCIITDKSGKQIDGVYLHDFDVPNFPNRGLILIQIELD